ncbi:lipoyl(octanoyl) transferase LipB [Candidatus Pelagibacter sp.]|nr:lipoyl(octanoyl) transferase LipB [Candidatus Pelagibacter sp.]
MIIEIKKSIKPIKYENAISLLEKRLEEIHSKKNKELIWILEHKEVYTAGTNYKDSELLDKSINLIKTNRGGKITYHGPGQLVFYFVIDLNTRKKNIRKLISSVENTIIGTLKEFKINVFADRKNVGIWHKKKFDNKIKIEKVAAIGIKVKKWIAYHGFSLNISNNLDPYTKIIPCGIKDKGITNLINIRKQKYNYISDMLVEKFLNEIKN